MVTSCYKIVFAVCNSVACDILPLGIRLIEREQCLLSEMSFLNLFTKRLVYVSTSVLFIGWWFAAKYLPITSLARVLVSIH